MSCVHIRFLGVGVMGEPMCRSLVRRHDGLVTCSNLDPAPPERLTPDCARVASSLVNLGDSADSCSCPSLPVAGSGRCA